MAHGDANELDASPIPPEGAKEGVVFLGLLDEFFLASEICVEADLEEDELAILAVKVIGIRNGADIQNMDNWPPIVAMGKEGLGKSENGKWENKVWCKSGIRCHIMNILVQHVWACENNVGNYVKCLKMDVWYSEIEVESK